MTNQMIKYSFNEKEHIHMLGDTFLTGTSTVMSVLAKPLTWWASGLAVGVMGWLNPKKSGKEECVEKATNALSMIKSMEVDEYITLLDKAYRAHAEKLDTSAEEGTDRHSLLEEYVKGRMEGREVHLENELKAFEIWSDKNVKKFLWSEIYCFSPIHSLGGISDCGAELNDGSVVIIDFKSSKEAYASHFMQIGGYDVQISENGGWTKDGQKVFTLEKPISKHIVIPFGAKDVVPVVSNLVEENKQGFLYALGLYRTLNKINNQ